MMIINRNVGNVGNLFKIFIDTNVKYMNRFFYGFYTLLGTFKNTD